MSGRRAEAGRHPPLQRSRRVREAAASLTTQHQHPSTSPPSPSPTCGLAAGALHVLPDLQRVLPAPALGRGAHGGGVGVHCRRNRGEQGCLTRQAGAAWGRAAARLCILDTRTAEPRHARKHQALPPLCSLPRRHGTTLPQPALVGPPPHLRARAWTRAARRASARTCAARGPCRPCARRPRSAWCTAGSQARSCCWPRRRPTPAAGGAAGGLMMTR